MSVLKIVACTVGLGSFALSAALMRLDTAGIPPEPATFVNVEHIPVVIDTPDEWQRNLVQARASHSRAFRQRGRPQSCRAMPSCLRRKLASQPL
jgi:hypothetical protein